MIGYVLAYFPLRFLPSRSELDQMSLARGQQVSFLRRVVAFLYDSVICLLLGALVLAISCLPGAGVIRSYLYLLPLVWMAYFMLCPILPGHGTVGHRLTRLKLVTPDGRPPRWYQHLVRYASLFLVLCWAPYLLNRLVSHLAQTGYLNDLAALVAWGALNSSFLFLLLFEAVRMAMRKPLFHERLSRTRLASTITPPPPSSPYLDSPETGGI